MTEKSSGFESMSVVEPPPSLLITMPKAAGGRPTIHVEGMHQGTAASIDWGGVVDLGIAIGKKLLNKGGSGGGATGCTTIKITNPDGSSTTITQCPPPTAEA